MPSVYIETTIPSYYHESRRTRQTVVWRDVTRNWWDRYRGGHQLYTSRAVLAELSRAPVAKAKSAKTLLKGIPILDEPLGLEEVIQYYMEHRLMPADTGGGDAYHLAIASMHSMDFLLTWNCRHLANANKIQHLTVLNHRLRLHVPIITTPLTLVPEEEQQ